MNSSDIREAFLHFFEEKGHRRVSSSSLVPKSDPTLLLTTAGMVQFKRYFTGEATPPHPRLASCQKCFRTTDIDAVGDPKHLTFFEMLGNFSVGDYFKDEATEWAWEFVTERLGLPQERLWITIFLDDDEAFDCWRRIGIPQERILRFGEKDNFWGPAGDSGPCGPCSEIHYDSGAEAGCGRPECDPSCDCGRFSEIWNLVFTQYDQREDGSRVPLPRPNIDTGMGLERTAAAMQGTKTVYETDLFAPLIEHVCKLSGKRYGENETTDRALRVVAEHGRAITFLIGDGVLPSNERRGYVLRRVLRRAALFGRKLGVEEQFLGGLAKVVITNMGAIYPELKRERKFILNAIEAEEGRFDQTLNVGIQILEGMVEGARASGRISGKDAFKLYDTYGFPAELTAEVAAENGLEVDMEGFEKEMEHQRERARAARKVQVGNKVAIEIDQPTCFVGYDSLKCRGDVTALAVNGGPVETAEEGQEVDVYLSQTPFYGEMGGQVGDSGVLQNKDVKIEVSVAVWPTPEAMAHRGRVVEGRISTGDAVEAKVDRERRLDIARNHTATHLLQSALRQVLGDHVRQSGSLVAPDHLRFDFTHPSALTNKELLQVQHLVNDKIRRNLKVKPATMPYEQALDRGALAFFEEKYEDEVRVMEIGRPTISVELCGGTHVAATGEIGSFRILSESSIGAGVRRIEVVSGRGAEEFVDSQLTLLEEVAEELKAAPSEIAVRIEALHKELDAARKKSRTGERESLKEKVDSLLTEIVEINGVPLLATVVPASDADSLRRMGDMIKDRRGSALVVLGAVYNGQANLVAMLTPDLVDKGLHAGEIVKQATAVIAGRGGGRAETAQGGGKDVDKLEDALKLVRELVASHGAAGA